tara:strand:+ start:686 stop:1087 length:402 start_codon:yes stop_codon:yes gene_type:complete
MKSLKNKIRKVLKENINISYRISATEPSTKDMNKKLFKEVLTELKKIDERRDFMIDEIGMDMTLYEDQFFSIIENLFKLAFNKEQLALIQMYLYQLVPDKEWDGTIVIEKNKKEATVDFKTPEDVWNVIAELS